MPIITTRKGKKKLQTREDVEEEKRKIEVLKAQQEALETGRLSAKQSLEAKAKEEERKEEAKKVITEAQPPEVPVEAPVETPDVPEPSEAPSLASLSGIGNLIEGRPVNIGGKTIQTGMRGTIEDEASGARAEVLGGSLPIGINPAVTSGQVPSLAGELPSFLSKTQQAGKVAGAKEIISAPAKAKTASSALKVSVASILGFSGLGSLKTITSNLLTKKVDKIETEVGKLGEQLTKIPETASLGFSLDEDGKLYEYSPSLALQELEGIEQSLSDAEVALQQAGIGNTYLKINGRYGTAQAEIDKQRREVTAARAKVLNIIANPSDSLQNSRDFFRGLDLIEE